MDVQNKIAPNQTSRLAVLFVDDEKMALEAFDMICQDHYPVFTASSVKDAEAILERHGDEIAVCFSDQRMPQDTGVDLLKNMRQRYPHIVRMLTTAYADHADVVAALNEAEIFRYIPKPWDVEAIRHVVASAMDHYLEQQRQLDLARNQRSNTLKVAGRIVHELRGSFATIGAGVSGIRMHLPNLLTVYDQARAAGVSDLPVLSQMHRNALGHVLDSMENQVREANVFMELMLAQARADSIDRTGFGCFAMADCVKQALDRFPFAKEQRQLVNTDLSNDFQFFGAQQLVVHVIFNLLRNALFALIHAGKGNISIRLECGTTHNRLYFRDSGSGIPADVLPHIFEDFFSTRTVSEGSGIGLGFCRTVTEAMGGTIDCQSVEGEFTEFAIDLPVAVN